MRTILISGASRGIGRSIAKKSLKDGHNISIGIRDLDSIKGSILDPDISGHERILVNKYDAENEASAKQWVKNTINKFNKLDTLINSAGIFRNTKFNYKNKEANDIKELFDINVMGPWQLTKAAWEPLSKSNNGRIFFLVSMSGKRSKGKFAGYTMSKFALMGLCQTIRNEGWDKNIRVTAICPSWVNTDMSSNINLIDKNNMTQSEDIASIISNIMNLPKSCIPFEIAMNCSLEI